MYVCVCVYVCVFYFFIFLFFLFFFRRGGECFYAPCQELLGAPRVGARQVDGLTCLVRWMDQIPLYPTSLSAVSLNKTPAELPLGITSRGRHQLICSSFLLSFPTSQEDRMPLSLPLDYRLLLAASFSRLLLTASSGHPPLWSFSITENSTHLLLLESVRICAGTLLSYGQSHPRAYVPMHR